MKGLCNKCSKKKNCTELCREAEEYVNQDYSPPSEIPVSVPILTGTEDVWNILNMDRKEVVRQVVIKLANDKMTTKEIAYHVPISKRHIRRIKRKAFKQADIN